MLIDTDPGEVFDKLAIINVKINLTDGLLKERNIKNFEDLSSQIEKEIGAVRFHKIFGSQEYKDLYRANLNTFRKVELAQKDNGLAKEVDNSNYSRYLSKLVLQKIFFNIDAKEIKIGY